MVGAATRDVDASDPRGWKLGGGVTYGALTAARLGTRVAALVGVDAPAAAAHELDLLRAEGVQVHPVDLAQGPVIENRRLQRGARVQLVHQASAPMPARALLAEWRGASAVLLAPVANELGSAWASVFAAHTMVALAWQGLLRRLVPGEPMIRLPLRPLALTKRAEIALVSADDAVAGGAGLDELLVGEGQQVVISHGHRGAIQLVRGGARLRGRYLPAMEPRRIHDETGAGDVFLAAWCAARLAAGVSRAADEADDSAAGWQPLAIATAAASLSVEGTLADLPDLPAVCRRLKG